MGLGLREKSGGIRTCSGRTGLSGGLGNRGAESLQEDPAGAGRGMGSTP